MKKRRLVTIIGVIGVLILVIIYQMNQRISVDAFKVSRGSIQEYIDETGTVKSQQSQTVYLNNSGRITSLMVDQGDLVHPGDVLIKMSPADLNIAKINADQAKNDYESARKDWEKSQKLFQEGAISKTDYDNTYAAFKRALNNFQSVNLELEKENQDLIVRAPLGGMVLEKSIDINQVVTAGTAAFIIGNPQNLEIDADILADEVVKIQPGDPVAISGQSTGGLVLQGKVRKVAPMAQNIVSSLGVNQKRTTVTIDFLKDMGSLKPGFDVDVRIFTQTKTKAIIVPASAVFDLHGKYYVFAIEKGYTRLRPIIKGIENDDQVEVHSGLMPGEFILAKPDNSIKEGIKVKIANG
jgi:HlyD family secretion protein